MMTESNRKFLHDVIKIKYIRLGYLPNVPYHLISDKEMFDAFLSSSISPLPVFQTKEASALLSDPSYEKVICKIDDGQGHQEIRIMSLNPFWGDANGDNKTNNFDSVRIRRYITGQVDEIYPGGDANGDGIVSEADDIAVLRFGSGMDDDTGMSINPLGPSGLSSATARYTYVKDLKGYFVDTYLAALVDHLILPDSTLSEFSDSCKALAKLVLAIAINIANYPQVEIPYWIYSYMIGQPVGPNSEYMDLHDMKQLMGLDVLDETITPEFMSKCLEESEKLVKDKSVDPTYCPTIFGDIYIQKKLRLEASGDM